MIDILGVRLFLLPNNPFSEERATLLPITGLYNFGHLLPAVPI
jgi:hypothetical protein